MGSCSPRAGHGLHISLVSRPSVHTSRAARYSTSVVQRAIRAPTGCTARYLTRRRKRWASIWTNGRSTSRAQGYPLIRGDAETVRLDRTFEVVFAGELLEHLTCFTQFFDTVRAHLDPGGSLVLTTPNAFGVSNFVYRLGGAVRVNDDHTCWFCRDTLRQLLAKNGFTMEQLTYLRSESPSRGRRSLARIVRAPLPEQLAWNTLVAMAKPT